MQGGKMSYALITFHPYIGSNYSTGGIFKKKILVLGESHYCSEEEACETLTYDVLQKYLAHETNEGWMNTFRKFERALIGKVILKIKCYNVFMLMHLKVPKL